VVLRFEFSPLLDVSHSTLRFVVLLLPVPFCGRESLSPRVPPVIHGSPMVRLASLSFWWTPDPT